MSSEIYSFSTLFMFLAVSSFAFAAVHSIKSSLLDFFNNTLTSIIKKNKSRQNEIFNFLLTKASIDFLENNDSLLEDIDKLKPKLMKLNKSSTNIANKKLTQIFKKYRLVSFGVGLQAFFLIVFAGLFNSNIIDQKYFSPFYIFIILTSIYLMGVCIGYKVTPKREVLHNFSKISIVITTSFLFSITLPCFNVSHDYLVFFIVWLIIQFFSITVIFPLYRMEKKIIHFRTIHNERREKLWNTFSTVKNAKEDVEKLTKDTLENNRKFLKNFNDKMKKNQDNNK